MSHRMQTSPGMIATAPNAPSSSVACVVFGAMRASPPTRLAA